MPRKPSKQWFKEQEKGSYPKISAFFQSNPSQRIQQPTLQPSTPKPESASLNMQPLYIPDATPKKIEIDPTMPEQFADNLDHKSSYESLSQTLCSEFDSAESQEIIGFPTISQSSDDSISDGEEILPSIIRFAPRPPLQRLRRCNESTTEDILTEQGNNSKWIERVIDTLKDHSQRISSAEPHPFKTLAKQWVSTGESFTESGGQCELCYHFPITYHFKIMNLKNQKQLWIGSECIKKFAEENLGLQQEGQISRGVEAKEQIRARVTTVQQEAEEARKQKRRFIM